MAKAVVDSTVLIFLAGLGRLAWMVDRFEPVWITPSVHQEVVEEGLALGKSDARVVSEAQKQGQLVSRSPATNDRVLGSGLEKADGEVISLALEQDAVVLSDDKAVRRIARGYGLGTRGTLYFLLDALKQGEIGFEEYLGALETLSNAGFRFSGTLYAKAVRQGYAYVDND